MHTAHTACCCRQHGGPSYASLNPSGERGQPKSLVEAEQTTDKAVLQALQGCIGHMVAHGFSSEIRLRSHSLILAAVPIGFADGSLCDKSRHWMKITHTDTGRTDSLTTIAFSQKRNTFAMTNRHNHDLVARW